MAALSCRGRIGECRFRVGVGDIQLDQAGPVELKSGAGDISVNMAVGDTQITTVSAPW